MAAEKTIVLHHPMTPVQRHTLNQDMATIMDSLGEITSLLRASHGDEDEQVYRAEEALAAVQRLVWAVQRHEEPPKRVAV